MNLNNVIRVVAEVKIAAGDRVRFESMVKDLRNVVEGEGPSKVLTYDCYCKNETSCEYLIIEDYADEASFLGHLRLIAPVSARHNVLMEVLKFYLCGSLSPDTLQMFENAYKEKFVNYESLQVFPIEPAAGLRVQQTLVDTKINPGLPR